MPLLGHNSFMQPASRPYQPDDTAQQSITCTVQYKGALLKHTRVSRAATPPPCRDALLKRECCCHHHNGRAALLLRQTAA